MKKSKTKLIVAITVIVVVVIAIIVGAILYLTTDLFKSNQEMFYKYLAKNTEMIEKLAKDDTKDLTQAIKQNQYTTDSKITFSLESNDTQLANQVIPVSSFSITSTSKTDNETNRKSSETSLKYLGNDLFIIKYLKNNDLYAIKSDEVVRKYLAFDNNNLKESMGTMSDINSEYVPNKLEGINLEDLFYISEQDKTAIQEKYMGVINANIPKNKFKKTKNVTITRNNKNISTTQYSLELTEQEINNLLINLLETLNTDDATLNMILSKIQILDSETTTTVNDIRNEIQKLIDDLYNSQTSEDIYVISVYASNDELLRTKIEAKGEKIIIDYTTNDTTIICNISFEKENNNNTQNNNNEENNDYVIDNIENDANIFASTTNNYNFTIKNIEIAKESQDNESNVIMAVTCDANNEIITVSLQNKKSIADNIESNIKFNVNIADNTYFIAEMKSTTSASEDIEIEELTTENSVTLNNYSQEEIKSLYEGIVNRLKTLYTQKIELITRVQERLETEQAEQNVGEINTQNNEENTTTNVITEDTTITQNNV